MTLNNSRPSAHATRRIRARDSLLMRRLQEVAEAHELWVSELVRVAIVEKLARIEVDRGNKSDAITFLRLTDACERELASATVPSVLAP